MKFFITINYFFTVMLNLPTADRLASSICITNTLKQVQGDARIFLENKVLR